MHIGYLGPSLKAPSTAAQYQGFLNHLKQAGFAEGQNLAVDYRRVDDPRGPFAVMAEPMRPPPKLIIAHGPEAGLQAVVGASQFIPIVIIAVNYDPLNVVMSKVWRSQVVTSQAFFIASWNWQ